jgi:hypothetical protein
VGLCAVTCQRLLIACHPFSTWRPQVWEGGAPCTALRSIGGRSPDRDILHTRRYLHIHRVLASRVAAANGSWTDVASAVRTQEVATL